MTTTLATGTRLQDTNTVLTDAIVAGAAEEDSLDEFYSSEP